MLGPEQLELPSDYAATLQSCEALYLGTGETMRQHRCQLQCRAPKPEIFMGDEFPSSQGLCAKLEWDYQDPFGGSRFFFIVGMPIQSYTNILLSQLSQA